MIDEIEGDADPFSFFRRMRIESHFPQIADAWAIPCDEFIERLAYIEHSEQ